MARAPTIFSKIEAFFCLINGHSHEISAMAILNERLEALLTKAWGPSLPVIIVTAFVTLLLPVLLHTWLYRTRKPTSLPTILIIGPSGAGKTSLLTLASPTMLCTVGGKANAVLPSSKLGLQRRHTSPKGRPQYKPNFLPPQRQIHRDIAPTMTPPPSNAQGSSSRTHPAMGSCATTPSNTYARRSRN